MSSLDNIQTQINYSLAYHNIAIRFLFTKHLSDQIYLSRNQPRISTEELQEAIFKFIMTHQKAAFAFMHNDPFVIRNTTTHLCIPCIKQVLSPPLDFRCGNLAVKISHQICLTTIMRKDDFRSPNPFLDVK